MVFQAHEHTDDLLTLRADVFFAQKEISCTGVKLKPKKKSSVKLEKGTVDSL